MYGFEFCERVNKVLHTWSWTMRTLHSSIVLHWHNRRAVSGIAFLFSKISFWLTILFTSSLLSFVNNKKKLFWKHKMRLTTYLKTFFFKPGEVTKPWLKVCTVKKFHRIKNKKFWHSGSLKAIWGLQQIQRKKKTKE